MVLGNRLESSMFMQPFLEALFCHPKGHFGRAWPRWCKKKDLFLRGGLRVFRLCLRVPHFWIPDRSLAIVINYSFRTSRKVFRTFIESVNLFLLNPFMIYKIRIIPMNYRKHWKFSFFSEIRCFRLPIHNWGLFGPTFGQKHGDLPGNAVWPLEHEFGGFFTRIGEFHHF